MKNYEITPKQAQELAILVNAKNKLDRDVASAILFLTGHDSYANLSLKGNILTVDTGEEIKETPSVEVVE